MKSTAVWLTGIITFISGCSIFPSSDDGAPRHPVNVDHVADPIPRVEPRSDKGNPPAYVVNGRMYHVLHSADNYRERGIASWYGTKFHGRSTSSGEPYNMYEMTAAHRTLPLPTYLQVTNLQNGKQVIVRVNDRGPFHGNRVIDLSYAAAKKLDILGAGTGMVEIVSINPQQWQKQRAAASQPRIVKVKATAPPRLFLQAGAFAQRPNAEQLKQELQELVLTHPIAVFDLSDKLYRVRIGPLPSVDSADQLTQLLTNKGFAEPHVVVE